jgi:hypothetical protein
MFAHFTALHADKDVVARGCQQVTRKAMNLKNGMELNRK